MTAFVYIIVYCAIAVFVAGCVRLVRRYASLPMHLRWELYPVPHEAAERASYGGSYFEDSEWWSKPQKKNRAGELRVMLREILLLRTVWERKRSLWWRSMLLHGGVFCALAAVVLRGCLMLPWSERLVNPVVAAAAVRALGYAGLTAITLGAVLLLVRRSFDRELQNYTYAADIAHLVMMGVAGSLLLAAQIFGERDGLGAALKGVLRFDTSISLGPLTTVGILFGAILLAYIPFSRMAHFIGKYFGYHSIRWDDRQNREEVLGRDIGVNLAFRPSWSARHIQGDGQKNWADIANENPSVAEVVK